MLGDVVSTWNLRLHVRIPTSLASQADEVKHVNLTTLGSVEAGAKTGLSLNQRARSGKGKGSEAGDDGELHDYFDSRGSWKALVCSKGREK